MTLLARLKYWYLAYFSHPASDRVLYRLLRKQSCQSIVEIGVGTAERTKRLLRFLGEYGAGPVRYTGIDLFEARPEGSPRIAYKQAHCQLTPLAAKVKLVPGDPFSALARVANDLTKTDLLLISADQSSGGADPASQSLVRAWFYVPRMLHPSSIVCVETTANGRSEFQFLDHAAVAERAASAPAPQRRAA